MYEYDCNDILMTAMKNISDKEIIQAFIELATDFKICRINPGLYFMDNESPAYLKMEMTTMDIKHQLVTPSNHRKKMQRDTSRRSKTIS